jgi:hypothetical protein
VNPSEYFYHKSLHDVIGPYDIKEHYAMDLDFLLRAVRVANVIYVNETWGNFRFVKGTKTFEDQQSGLAAQRVKDLLKLYRKELPEYFQKIFWLYKIIQSIVFVIGYLRQPSRLFVAIRRMIEG